MNWRTPENQFTVGYLSALFVGLIVIILAAKGDMHPLWEWMHKWQTLIAGTFALVAAAIAWRAVQIQIAAEDRRERNRKKFEFVASRAHLMQLRKWTRIIRGNFQKVVDYQPAEDAIGDESLNQLFANTSYVKLQTSERLRAEMSVNTLMELKFVDQLLSVFHAEAQDVRSHCEGDITLFNVAGETLEQAQQLAASVVELLLAFEKTLSRDITNISCQIEEMES